MASSPAEAPHHSGPGAPPGDTPRRLLLVSVPRTASNLLLKILNIPNQPRFKTNQKGGYFFYPAFTSTAPKLAKPVSEWAPDDKVSVQDAFQECLDRLEEASAQAQKENKAMFAKEHAFWFFNPASLQQATTSHADDPEFIETCRSRIPEAYGPAQTWSRANGTVMSDEYLRSWQMAFTIRHPALAWPSFYRAMSKLLAVGFIDEDGLRGSSRTNMTLRWTRMLYDWCLEQADISTAPPIIDAHDLIHSPEVVLKFCEQTGLDKSALQFEWDGECEPKESPSWAEPVVGKKEATPEQVQASRDAAAVIFATIEASKGIIKEKAPTSVDIAAEAAKWKVEFGEDVARLIEKATWDAMPDYEYLKARRMTV